ncbi:MAG: anaerobic ribonucleoside-triphosphate reductase activating protein [bacterium]|nr:anaerobic ribonucleoside-triphosphate reductase activating protein [bacterium]
MQIAGLQKTTLIDFPGQIAAVFFTPGCSFRCPFCYNRDLVLKEQLTLIPEEEIFSFLKSRIGKLDGVVLCGGEPTLQEDLRGFCSMVRDLGFMVKLDTNGFLPERLKELLAQNLLDYVSLDVKTAFDAHYLEATGLSGDWSPVVSAVKESLHLLKQAGIKFDVRTTLVPRLHPFSVLSQMAKDLAGVPVWYWQQFQALNCLNPEYNLEKLYPLKELEKMRQDVGPKVKIEIR